MSSLVYIKELLYIIPSFFEATKYNALVADGQNTNIASFVGERGMHIRCLGRRCFKMTLILALPGIKAVSKEAKETIPIHFYPLLSSNLVSKVCLFG